MNKGIRRTMIMRVVLTLLALVSLSSQAQTIKESTAFAVIVSRSTQLTLTTTITSTQPPRKAETTLSATGTFDNFNRFALRGRSGSAYRIPL